MQCSTYIGNNRVTDQDSGTRTHRYPAMYTEGDLLVTEAMSDFDDNRSAALVDILSVDLQKSLESHVAPPECYGGPPISSDGLLHVLIELTNES